METYQCANCGDIHDKTRSDAECWDEMLDNFPAQDLYGEEIAVVCDDCYQAIMARVRAEAPELLREQAR